MYDFYGFDEFVLSLLMCLEFFRAKVISAI